MDSGSEEKIGQFRYRSLHAISHFVLGHARENLRVAKALGIFLIQLSQIIEEAAAYFTVDYRADLKDKAPGRNRCETLRPDIVKAGSHCPTGGHTMVDRRCSPFPQKP